MTTAELTHLRRLYADICRGYSMSEWLGQPVYIKHLTVFDQTEIDAYYEEALAKNISRGLYTEQSRLDYLHLNAMWTKRDEFALKEQRDFIANLHKTRSRVSMKVQADQLTKQIDEETVKLNQMWLKRSRLLGLTAEKVSEEQMQYEYIRATFFKDRTFTSPLFTQEDMNQLSDEDSDTLLALYIGVIQQFDNKVIRSLSVQPFFTNTFYLCKDDIRAFLGKPLVELSLYQTNLLSNGQYFKSILTNNDVPADMIQDPDKLEDFVIRSRNVKNVVDKASVSKGGRVGLVGAVAEDFAALGAKDSTNEMRQVAQKQYKTGREGAQDLGFTYTN